VIVEPPERALNQSGQFVGSAADGLVHGRCLVSDRDGRAAFEAGFHHAVFVALAVLMALFVAQVNFHPRDVSAEPAQGTLHSSVDMSAERLVSSNVVVGIDLDLHNVRPL